MRIKNPFPRKETKVIFFVCKIQGIRVNWNYKGIEPSSEEL